MAGCGCGERAADETICTDTCDYNGDGDCTIDGILYLDNADELNIY